MRLRMMGLSHQTAPVAFRERVALDDAGLVRMLNSLREAPFVDEALVLSTCNRTEIYVVQTDDADHHVELGELLAREAGVERREIDDFFYRRSNRQVVEHLFMVAASLDSMVVGENQILAQVRAAYSRAVTCRTNGPLLNKLLHRSLRVGKRVRSETGIGEGHVSVAAVACDLAEKIFADLGERTVLLIGAGETGELVARHAVDRGVRDLVITNRTHARAEALAERLGGRAAEWDTLWTEVARADVLVTSTAATEPVITAAPLQAALRGREAPLFVIDIAVPRDVEPAVDGLPDVFLYDLDALQDVVHESVDRRRDEVHRARSIVAEQTDRFVEWHRRQQVTPTIIQMREQFEHIRELEVEKLRHSLSDEDFERVQRMSRALVNKLLHHPTVQMKQVAGKADGGSLIKGFRLLLGLDEEGDA